MSDKTCAVYHWWRHPSDAEPYQVLRAPIILSIATLRAVSDMPIFVIDVSPQHGNWSYFPEKLNFQVKQRNPHLLHLKDQVKFDGFMNLSRHYDIRMESKIWPELFQCENLMYVDSDVFWFNNPLPLERDTSKFCFDGWNCGFFYYNQNTINPDYFKIFDAYMNAAIWSKEIRDLMIKYLGYNPESYGVVDEMITTLMVRDHPELFNITSHKEHGIIYRLEAQNVVNMLHAVGIMVENKFPKIEYERDHSRGLLGLLVKEFYDNICKVLNQDDLNLIFTEPERQYYLPLQFSFQDELPKLLAIRDEKGNCVMSNYLNQKISQSII